MLRKIKGFQIYLSFLGTVLAFALTWWANEYFALRVHLGVCILYCLVFAVLVYLFDRSKNAVRYIVLLSMLPSMGLIFLIAKTNPYKWVKNIINWCIEYDGTQDLYEYMPAYTVLAVASLLCCIILYVLMKKSIIRLLMAPVIFTVFVVFSILQIELDKAVVGIGFFYILCSLIEFSGLLYSRKSGKMDKKESMLYLLPVCLLLAVVSVVLPSKPEPIQWAGVKKVYYAIKDQIDEWITEWEIFTGKDGGLFSISLSGYSDDGSLDNEDISSNEKIALIVRGQRGMSPIYLTGSVSDTYTGYSWEKSKEDFLPGEQEYHMDYAELIYGLSRLDPGIIEENDFLKTLSVNLFYKKIKTKTFFYPAKSYSFNFVRPVIGLNTEYASITFPKAMGGKTSYFISYYEMNLRGQHFQDMLRSADGFSYEDSNDIDYEQIDLLEKMLYVRDKENFVLNRKDFYELFKKRAEIIRKNYTQLPENLPQRVKDLAIDITKNEDNNYDKLKAIEQFLLQYTYTFKPGKVPKGSDFVDYFLFDNRKGYCTSFATSMAVLGRCIGIPTRYVEGFLVDYSERANEGYLVRSNSAHAWVEAYFEGVGWIPFEPTPGFNESRYTAWPSRSKDKTDDNNYYNITIPQEPPMERTNELINGSPKENKKTSEVLIWILVAAGVLAILLGALTCYFLVLEYRYRIEFKNADYSIKMYMIFIRILIILKYEGFVLGKQETLLMLCDKVKDRYLYGNVKFRDVANIYMAYRYGEIPVAKKDYDTVNIFYKGLSEYRKSNSKKIQQAFEEFIFLIKRNGLNVIG